MDTGKKYIIQQDGDLWFCAQGDFINLVESDAEFGSTPSDALRCFLEKESGIAPAASEQDAQSFSLLAEDHSSMRVDYSGLLGQVQHEIKHSAPGHAELVRQLQGHIKELGAAWYAGQTQAVDEFLQLYCVESETRAAIAAQKGGAV